MDFNSMLEGLGTGYFLVLQGVAVSMLYYVAFAFVYPPVWLVRRLRSGTEPWRSERVARGYLGLLPVVLVFVLVAAIPVMGAGIIKLMYRDLANPASRFTEVVEKRQAAFEDGVALARTRALTGDLAGAGSALATQARPEDREAVRQALAPLEKDPLSAMAVAFANVESFERSPYYALSRAFAHGLAVCAVYVNWGLGLAIIVAVLWALLVALWRLLWLPFAEGYRLADAWHVIADWMKEEVGVLVLGTLVLGMLVMPVMVLEQLVVELLVGEVFGQALAVTSTGAQRLVDPASVFALALGLTLTVALGWSLLLLAVAPLALRGRYVVVRLMRRRSDPLLGPAEFWRTFGRAMWLATATIMAVGFVGALVRSGCKQADDGGLLVLGVLQPLLVVGLLWPLRGWRVARVLVRTLLPPARLEAEGAAGELAELAEPAELAESAESEEGAPIAAE